MTNLREEFKGYEKQLQKMGVSLYEIASCEDSVQIEMTQNNFEKLGRKNFPAKPTEIKVEMITVRQYLCYITSIGFFGDRVEKGYTYMGYIPTKLTCVSPDKEKKIIRQFKVTKIN